MGERVRAVMFDLDGTLVDTIADIAHAMNLVLRGNGYEEHGESAYRSMVGSGLRELVRRATPTGTEVDRLAGELHDAYRANPCRLATVYPGIHELLSSLADRGLELMVLSNKADDLARTVVATLFADVRFAQVQGMRDGVPAKPDPQGALEMLARSGVEPSQTVYLGDSDVDMLTARRAGMIAVGAAWGFRGAEELLAAGAAYVFDQPLDLVRIVSGEGEE